MNQAQALAVFLQHVPETGTIPYSDLYEAMQATGEGRRALGFFHTLRRDSSVGLYAKIVDHVHVVSRQPFPAE